MSRLNKIFLVLLCLAVTLVIGNVELKAQICPSGSNYTSFLATVGNCQYSVDICYDCPPTGGPDHYSIFGVNNINPSSCSTSLTFGEVLEDIISQLNSNGFLAALCTEMPPCSLNNDYVYDVKRPRCWKKYHSSNGDIYYTACGEDYFCVKQWKACQGPSSLQLTELTDWLPVGGTPDCSGDEPAHPPVGEYSNCWLEYEQCEPE